MKNDIKVVKLPVKNNDKLNSNYKRSAKKKRKINLINLVFVVFMFYFFMTSASQSQMIKNLDAQIDKKESERDLVKKKAENLANDVASIDDQEVLLEVVERIARNEYKMVKPNEVIYIDKGKANNKFIIGIGSDQNNIDIKDEDQGVQETQEVKNED